jgi:hypothetical protein
VTETNYHPLVITRLSARKMRNVGMIERSSLSDVTGITFINETKIL